MNRLIISLLVFVMLTTTAFAFHFLDSFRSLFSMNVIDGNGRRVGTLLGPTGGTGGGLVGFKINGKITE